jgi:uncharacterized protein YjeT (DUF2065 family)
MRLQLEDTMIGQPFTVAGPSVGAAFFAAAGVVLTFFPGLVQRCGAGTTERSTSTLTQRVVGVSLFMLAAAMVYADAPVYAAVAAAVDGAAYAFWPRTVQRLSVAHVRSRAYAWELRVMGVCSLAAAAVIVYRLVSG